MKGLKELLEKFKKGEIADETAFEAELNKVLPETWVPKTTFNEKSEALKLAEKQAKDMETQLTSLKDKAGLSDDYKKQIEDLQAQNAKQKTEFDSQMKATREGYALDKALSTAKARNAKAVKALLDTSKITYGEDGSVTGLDEQIKALKESDSYLFEEEQKAQEPAPQPTFPSWGNPVNPSNGGGNPDNNLFAQMAAAAGLPTPKTN